MTNKNIVVYGSIYDFMCAATQGQDRKNKAVIMDLL
jgi:hypothetical protein